MQRLTCLFSIVFVTAATCSAAPHSSFRFVEDAERGTLTVFDGSDPVLTYNFGEQLHKGVDARYRRSCYIHPLYGLHGEILTADFVGDHPHHRGVSWMWPRMKARGKEVQTWHPSELRQVFVRWISRDADQNGATLEVENAWKLDAGQGEKVALEVIRIRIHRAEKSGRAIDLDLNFHAVGGTVELLGASGKGYGGLNVRFADGDGRALQTDHDQPLKKSDHERFEWVDLSAAFGKGPAISGATVMADPQHPDYPPQWTLRTGYAGIINAAWPGLNPYTLRPGVPLHLGYRIHIHDLSAQTAQVGHAHAAYVESTQDAGDAGKSPERVPLLNRREQP